MTKCIFTLLVISKYWTTVTCFDKRNRRRWKHIYWRTSTAYKYTNWIRNDDINRQEITNNVNMHLVIIIIAYPVLYDGGICS
jgi:hypothetical protein